MSVIVRIPTPLRKTTNGADKIDVEAGTLQEIIESINIEFPGMKEKLCDANGNLKSFVNIYVNDENIRFLNGMNSIVLDNGVVSIVPAVAGGI
jgi:molybdopterin synthase sulfur carrier subunit